jgi:hypothetical protein
LKIVPLEVLVDREGWKMSMLKGMYIARMPALIPRHLVKGELLHLFGKKTHDPSNVCQNQDANQLSWRCVQQPS